MTDTAIILQARPTFLGALAILESARREPRLELSVTCSHCRRKHFHSWNVEPGDDASHYSETHRQAHCTRDDSPHRGLLAGYMIAPARTNANARTLARYGELVRRYRRREQRRERMREALIAPAPPCELSSGLPIMPAGEMGTGDSVQVETRTTTEVRTMAATTDFQQVIDALREYGINVPDEVDDAAGLVIAIKAQSQASNADTGDGNLDLYGDTAPTGGATAGVLSDGRPAGRGRRGPTSELGKVMARQAELARRYSRPTPPGRN